MQAPDTHSVSLRGSSTAYLSYALYNVTFCFSADLLKVEGMDMKVSEPINAAHLINAAKLGNSKADAVLNKGQVTKQAHIHGILFKKFKQVGYLM